MDQVRHIRGSQPGRRIPARRRRITDRRVHQLVVTDRDIVKVLAVAAGTRDLLQRRVDKAERAALRLVGEREKIARALTTSRGAAT